MVEKEGRLNFWDLPQTACEATLCLFGSFGRRERLAGCGVWPSWCKVAVLLVWLLLRYSSRENRFWLEAEEWRFCCSCWWRPYRKGTYRTSCYQYGGRLEAGTEMGLHIVCAMVQVGASWLSSGQNEELRPWWQWFLRLQWDLGYAGFISVKSYHFSVKNIQLHHMVTTIIIFIFCLYDLTSLGFKPVLFPLCD